MDERKEKLVAYLSKNLQIAELTVAEFEKVKNEIADLKEKLEKKEAELLDLGDIDIAIANVDEIRGFIEDLTKPEELPEDNVNEAEIDDNQETEQEESVEECCAIPTDPQFDNTTPAGGVTFF